MSWAPSFVSPFSVFLGLAARERRSGLQDLLTAGATLREPEWTNEQGYRAAAVDGDELFFAYLRRPGPQLAKPLLDVLTDGFC